MFNRLDLGEQNANRMNKNDTVVSLQSASGEKIDDEYTLFYQMRTQPLLIKVITDEEREAFMKGFSGQKMIWYLVK